MIKVRLHGTPEEVQAAKKVLEKSMNVLQASREYKDKGESQYVRVYVEVELKKQLSVEEIFEA